MILYTVQPKEVLNIIKEEGYFRPDKDKLDNPEFIHAYDWLKDKMREKIGGAPDPDKYPVWAWYDTRGMYTDFFHNDCIKNTDCMIVLDIPDDKVLLTDYDAWHYVLNNWYYAPELREKEYDEMVEKYEKYLYGSGKLTKNEDVRKTWNKIILSEKPKGIYNEVHTFGENDGPITEQNVIQATFWEIRPENIVRVVELEGMRESEVDR